MWKDKNNSKLYMVKENRTKQYIKKLKKIRKYLLLFATLYGVIMFAVLPLMSVLYESIIIIPWLLLLIYVISLSRRIYKFNKNLLIKYNNKEYIPPLKLDISPIEWIQNELTYDFPTLVKNVINYVMSLPDTVKCSVCGGTGEVLMTIHHTEYTTESVPLYPDSPLYDDWDSSGNWKPHINFYTTKLVPTGKETIEEKYVKCKHCGGLGYFYIRETKDKIRVHGYELINDFNNFLNTYPNLKDDIQSLNSKLQIYVSRLKFIKDTFYS